MKKIILFVFSALLILHSAPSYSIYQDAIATLKKYIQQDPTIANAIVLYPENIRTAIFEAAQYPQVMASLGPAQEKSSQDFKGLLLFLSTDQQAKVYDLVRFPELLNAIVQGGNKSEAELQALAQKYPEKIRKTAVELGSQKYALLADINKLYQNSEGQFQNELKELPEQVQEAFKTLVDNPEVLSLLNQNTEFTHLLGEAYRQDPEEVQKRSKLYAAKVQEQKKQALEEWSQQLEQDPEALKETQQAAQQFAQDNDYEPSDLEAEESQVKLSQNYNPYPYWIGSPGWYDTPTWRPYPLWYDTGWYYGPDRRMVWVGLPSYRYTHWYYDNAYRRYGRLTNHYDRYYDRYDRVDSGFHHRTREYRSQRVASPTAFEEPRAIGTPRQEARMEGQAFEPAPRAVRSPRTTPYTTRSTVYGNAPGRNYNTFRANNYHRSSWGRAGVSPRGGGMRGGGGRR